MKKCNCACHIGGKEAGVTSCSSCIDNHQPTPAVEPVDIEILADIEHQRWSHWQKYIHSKMSVAGIDFIIPGVLVGHWERQIKTDYKDLSEREKEEDRKQVRRYLPIFTEALLAKDKQIEKLKGVSKCWELGFIKWKDEYNELKSENTALQSKLDEVVGFLKKESKTEEQQKKSLEDAEHCGMNTKLGYFGDCNSCKMKNNRIIDFLASLPEQKPERKDDEK